MGARIRRVVGFLVVVALATLGMATVQPQIAQAANLVVTTTADNTTVDGFCSLREAIIAANADSTTADCGTASGADTITFNDPGPYVLTSALPLMTTDITIDGSGHPVRVTIDANSPPNGYRVLDHAGPSLTINQLVITGGNSSSAFGGGVLTGASFTATNSVIRDNTGGLGGGLHVRGLANITSTTISGNTPRTEW